MCAWHDMLVTGSLLPSEPAIRLSGILVSEEMDISKALCYDWALSWDMGLLRFVLIFRFVLTIVTAWKKKLGRCLVVMVMPARYCIHQLDCVGIWLATKWSVRL